MALKAAPRTRQEFMQRAKRTSAFLMRQVDLHQVRFETAIGKLEQRIVGKIKRLKADKEGKLLSPKVNLAQAKKIHAELKAEFAKTYGRQARSTVANFDELVDEVQDSLKGLGHAVKFTGIDLSTIKQLKKSIYEEFEEFGTTAQDAIAKNMYDHILGGAPFSELVNAVSATLTGKYDIRGRSMTTYAQQYAFDATMNFHNAVSIMGAEEAGLSHFLYVGSVIEESRPFCRARVGKTFSRETIEGWTHSWKGSAGPAMQYRGGYNCRHHWAPTDPDWIPGDEIDPEVMQEEKQLQETEKERKKTAEQKALEEARKLREQLKEEKETAAIQISAERAKAERLSEAAKQEEVAGTFIAKPKETDPAKLEVAKRVQEDEGYRYGLEEDGNSGDAKLKAVAKEQGFTGLPHVVSEEELDGFVAKGEIEVWRGIGEAGKTKAYGKDFVEGDYYAGYGISGNGTYTTTNRDEAIRYALEEGEEGGSLLRMTIKKEAKIVNHDDLAGEAVEFEAKLSERRTALRAKKMTPATEQEIRKIDSLLELYEDEGVFAAARGYDVIYIEGDEYYVVLNRTAVRVNKEIEWVS